MWLKRASFIHPRRSISNCRAPLTRETPFFFLGADDSPAAFSNIVLANGAASAVAYFTFPSLQKVILLYICIQYMYVCMYMNISVFYIFMNTHLFFNKRRRVCSSLLHIPIAAKGEHVIICIEYIYVYVYIYYTMHICYYVYLFLANGAASAVAYCTFPSRQKACLIYISYRICMYVCM